MMQIPRVYIWLTTWLIGSEFIFNAGNKPKKRHSTPKIGIECRFLLLILRNLNLVTFR